MGFYDAEFMLLSLTEGPQPLDREVALDKFKVNDVVYLPHPNNPWVIHEFQGDLVFVRHLYYANAGPCWRYRNELYTKEEWLADHELEKIIVWTFHTWDTSAPDAINFHFNNKKRWRETLLTDAKYQIIVRAVLAGILSEPDVESDPEAAWHKYIYEPLQDFDWSLLETLPVGPGDIKAPISWRMPKPEKVAWWWRILGKT